MTDQPINGNYVVITDRDSDLSAIVHRKKDCSDSLWDYLCELANSGTLSLTEFYQIEKRLVSL